MTHDDARPTDGITVEEGPDRTVVRMRGDIDGALRGQASAAMAQSLGRAVPVTVDVAGVTFIDSTGLAFLLQLHKAGEEGGIEVALLDPPALILDLLDMIGMAGVIPLRWTPARPAATEAASDDATPATAREAVSDVGLDAEVARLLDGPGELTHI